MLRSTRIGSFLTFIKNSRSDTEEGIQAYSCRQSLWNPVSRRHEGGLQSHFGRASMSLQKMVILEKAILKLFFRVGTLCRRMATVLTSRDQLSTLQRVTAHDSDSSLYPTPCASMITCKVTQSSMERRRLREPPADMPACASVCSWTTLLIKRYVPRDLYVAPGGSHQPPRAIEEWRPPTYYSQGYARGQLCI